MKIHIFVLSILSILCINGCSKSEPDYKKIFTDLAAQNFQKNGRQCIRIVTWDIKKGFSTLSSENRNDQPNENQMAALEKLGLLNVTEATVQENDFLDRPSGPKIAVKRYSISDKAKPFSFENNEQNIFGKKIKATYLCWGAVGLNQVTKWEGPMKFGDYAEAEIFYTYKIIDLADWAKNPILKQSFPYVDRILNGEGKIENHIAAKLTSNGWERK